MKAKALRIGKAMSAALFVLLLVVVGTKNALAQNLVATLQHGDNISMYYGPNAFVQAHNAAQTGDVITLSSGTFNTTTITKAITLRGAGCCMDSVTGIRPTYISNLVANVPDEEHSLTIEGVCVSQKFTFTNLNNPKFIKCNFNEVNRVTGSNDMMQNAQFVNCMIKKIGNGVFWYSSYNGPSVYATNINFTNCYVCIDPRNLKVDTGVGFVNSIVSIYPDDSGYQYVTESVMAINSIFYCYRYGGAYSFSGSSSSCLFYNCVSIPSNYFNSQNSTNIQMNNFSDVFETFTGNFQSYSERFVLKEDFATSFLGNDGTEVGIHGGLAPYNPRPNYMVLKQCNVASQSTIDNKLSVEIRVVAEGE